MSQQIRKRKDNTPGRDKDGSRPDPLAGSSEPLLEKKDDGMTEIRKVHSPQKEKLISSSSASADSETAYDFFFTLITVLAIFTRLYKIHDPNQVVFDEVHFGKFASYYLRREFFFDVHPPLGKMLIAFAGWFLNYDGHFLFDKIGLVYTENNVPYIGLRVFCAIWGILVVPMGFMILREMGVSLAATVLGSAMLLLDNALIAQSRLILLDSQLMFFCTLTIYCWIRFFKLRFWPFTVKWWTWLSLTGVALALTLGVKMVGLFGFATIGIATIIDLWELLDINRGLSARSVYRHFVARFLCLIVLPLMVYLSFFYIHFAILTNSGPGDDFMSKPFQEGLINNKITGNATAVPFYANVTIKHQTKAWLHSHPEKYPLRYKDGRVSSQGQQVTAYAHSDVNNVWVIEPADPELFSRVGKYEPSDLEKERNVRYIKNHDVVRLRHVVSDTYMITHDVASPLTTTNMEITTLSPELADQRYDESLWEVVIAINGGKKQAPNNTQIISRRHNLIFVNIQHNVALYSSKNLLPEWGFKQQEVNGNKKVVSVPGNEWVIDTVEHERIVNGKDIDDKEEKEEEVKEKTQMSFMKKFLELQSLMLIHNSRLTSSHPYSSHAASWPFVIRGISYWETKVGFRQIYVLGNPLIWWSVAIFLVVFFAFYVIDIIALRRGSDVLGWEFRSWWLRGSGFLVMAWGFHWFPFFIMGRQLFLHHYFPAFIFSVLAVSSFIDFLFRVTRLPSPGSPSAFWHWNQNRWGGYFLWSIVTVLLTIYTISFYFFLPLTYGSGFPNQVELGKRKWFSTWDLQHALRGKE